MAHKMNTKQQNIISQAISNALELNNYLDDDQIQEAANMLQKAIDTNSDTEAVEAMEYLVECVRYRGKKPDLFQQQLDDFKKAEAKPLATRADYLAGRISHRQYWAQFVNDEVKRAVLMHFGKERLLASKDEHLNDLPLREWDALGGFVFGGGDIMVKPTTSHPIDYKLLKETGEGYSASTAVSTYKEAARQLIEQWKGGKLYKVRRDSETLFIGTNNECFEWLLKHQGQSVHHATTYEGYQVIEL